MTISLNASTLTEKTFESCRRMEPILLVWKLGTIITPDQKRTGCWLVSGEEPLVESTRLFVQAFVPGDAKKRGPLFQGLPTLERHRNWSPFAAAIDLLATGSVDAVYIGDGMVSEKVPSSLRRICKKRGSFCGSKILVPLTLNTS